MSQRPLPTLFENLRFREDGEANLTVERRNEAVIPAGLPQSQNSPMTQPATLRICSPALHIGGSFII